MSDAKFVLGIDHVQLAMPPGGEEVARTFYAGLLGIPEVPKPADRIARGGAWFETGSVRLHMGVEADFRPARKAHPALLVRDLRGLVQKLRAAGVDVAEEQTADDDRAHLADPFGNRIELIRAKT